jgi:hypothetical protein
MPGGLLILLILLIYLNVEVARSVRCVAGWGVRNPQFAFRTRAFAMFVWA